MFRCRAQTAPQNPVTPAQGFRNLNAMFNATGGLDPPERCSLATGCRPSLLPPSSFVRQAFSPPQWKRMWCRMLERTFSPPFVLRLQPQGRSPWAGIGPGRWPENRNTIRSFTLRLELSSGHLSGRRLPHPAVSDQIVPLKLIKYRKTGPGYVCRFPLLQTPMASTQCTRGRRSRQKKVTQKKQEVTRIENT